MFNPKDVTALIITSAVKSIPEIRKNIYAISKISNDISLIEKVIQNIKYYSSISNFIIVHDFKINSKDSRRHNQNLIKLQKIYKFSLFVSPSSLEMPSQLTASNAFKLGISKINSNHFLFWEHDHLFTKKVNWEIVSNCFLHNGKLLKFNRKINKISCANNLQKEYILEKGMYHFIGQSDHYDFVETNFYCNGPFISDTNFCKNLWKNVNYDIPNWNGMFGGFIEGPVNQKMLEEQLNLSRKEFREKYPIYCYGNNSCRPIVIHRGDYIPKYKFNIFLLETYINLPKILKHKILNFFKDSNISR